MFGYDTTLKIELYFNNKQNLLLNVHMSVRNDFFSSTEAILLVIAKASEYQ